MQILASFFLPRSIPFSYTYMMNDPAKKDKATRLIIRLVADLYEVGTVYRQPDRIILGLTRADQHERAETLLRDRLTLAGYDYDLQSGENLLQLSVNPRRKLSVPSINILLFILTLLSVYLVPVFYLNPEGMVAALSGGAGLIFTAAIMSILFVHEMGHYLAGRRRGIITSLPYFIPAPTIIGTFGAVIKSKSPFWNRRDLIEVGAAGPIAGWIVALGWLIYGVSTSTVLAPDAAPANMWVFSLDGESILMRALMPIIGPGTIEDARYILNEAAFAGWVGLLITAMNLLPIGQFDGGHILYGAARRWQRPVAYLSLGLLVFLGLEWKGWWLFAGFGIVFGVVHPPTLDDRIPPSRMSIVLAVISLLIMILSFTPVPFQ